MKLTGKAKEDFKEWFNNLPMQKSIDKMRLVAFYTLPPSMQYGVYVDWFDSVGLSIRVGIHYDDFEDEYIGFHPIIFKPTDFYQLSWSLDLERTRAEARTKAIEKATETYNNK